MDVTSKFLAGTAKALDKACAIPQFTRIFDAVVQSGPVKGPGPRSAAGRRRFSDALSAMAVCNVPVERRAEAYVAIAKCAAKLVSRSGPQVADLLIIMYGLAKGQAAAASDGPWQVADIQNLLRMYLGFCIDYLGLSLDRIAALPAWEDEPECVTGSRHLAKAIVRGCRAVPVSLQDEFIAIVERVSTDIGYPADEEDASNLVAAVVKCLREQPENAKAFRAN